MPGLHLVRHESAKSSEVVHVGHLGSGGAVLGAEEEGLHESELLVEDLEGIEGH